MKVSELMSHTVISVSPEATATTAAKLLTHHNIGSAPVIGNDGRLCGIITDRDIVTRCIASENNPESTSVRDVMSRYVFGISPEADIREVAKLMADEQVRRIPVIDDGKVVGIVSLADMARSNHYQMETSRALSDISIPQR